EGWALGHAGFLATPSAHARTWMSWRMSCSVVGCSSLGEGRSRSASRRVTSGLAIGHDLGERVGDGCPADSVPGAVEVGAFPCAEELVDEGVVGGDGPHAVGDVLLVAGEGLVAGLLEDVAGGHAVITPWLSRRAASSHLCSS